MQKLWSSGTLKRMCEDWHVPVARIICQKLPLASATTLRTRSHAAANSCGAWTSSETAAYLWGTGLFEGSIVKKSWRRTFVGMDVKNICTALETNPHGESHVSEEHGASDCCGSGTRQHRIGRGTSDLVEAQHDVWKDVAFVLFTCSSVL